MFMLAKYIKDCTEYKVFLSGEGADELVAGYNVFMGASEPDAVNEETKRLIRNVHMFDGLRADRCFAAHGLEIRMPFADKFLLREVFALSGEHKMYKDGREKSLLRDAFNDIAELKRACVIGRQKECFSNGCGGAYVPFVLNHMAPDCNTFGEKERIGADTFAQWFDEAYPGLRHIIIERKNPVWCNDTNDELLQF
jgi:hypothetical protein